MADTVTSPTHGEEGEAAPTAPPMPADAAPSPAAVSAPIGPESPIFAILETTRAMRRLRPDPVPDELLHEIIRAATWAPSAMNGQAEAFILVTDRSVMADLAHIWRRVVDDYLLMAVATSPTVAGDPGMIRLRGAIDYQRDHFADTPAVIVACYDMRGLKRSRRDLGTLRRMVRALGLRRSLRLARVTGTFLSRSQAGSIYPAVQNLLLAARASGLAACMTTWHLMAEQEVKALLGIPAEVETFAVIPVGWPLGSFGPVRRRPVDEVIHRDRWRSGSA